AVVRKVADAREVIDDADRIPGVANRDEEILPVDAERDVRRPDAWIHLDPRGQRRGRLLRRRIGERERVVAVAAAEGERGPAVEDVVAGASTVATVPGEARGI